MSRPAARAAGATHLLAAVLAAAAFFGVLILLAQPSPAQRDSRNTLRPAADFAGIRDSRARAEALFREAGKVLVHPRCTNCHPRGDAPLQGEKGEPHRPPVVRGPDNMGAPGMRCGTCHGATNFEPARVPGAPHWQLAPRHMSWVGKSLGEICRQIKDPKRNGNHTVAEIVGHMQKDPLVGWAWNPGARRRPPPGTWQRFGELIAAWHAAGGHCPPK